MIQGVVFDLDGVIADTEPLWEESWTDYTKRHGYGWTPADTEVVQGMSAPEWARYIAGIIGGDAGEIERECVGYLVDALRAGRVRPLPGAADLVAATAGRLPIALASSAARPVIDAVLAAFGMTDRFSATVSSAEVPRGKPAPDVYAQAVCRLGIEARDGVAVEDSGNGILAAHAAGLTVIAIPNPVYPPKAEALALASQIARSAEDARDRIVALIDEEAIR